MIRSALALLSLGSLLCASAAQAQRALPAKKLIEYGWDVPEVGYVRQHIREMEKRPFDGLIFRLPPEFGQVFTVAKWDEAKFTAALEDGRGIQWGSFTDNFIIAWSASTMDWFSDRDWEIVRHNVGLMARAAAAARCKGLCFDPEPYAGNPWSYSEAAHRADKSFAQYEAQVRKRGAEFMRAITGEQPDTVVHTFFLLSLFSSFASAPDPAQREAMLARHSYGLLPAFVNGMLDAAGPKVMITDGNESAYYYTEPLSYYTSYHWVRQGALAFVAPENVGKYQTQLQASQALYVDHVFNLRGPGAWVSSALSPEERARWFEQDVYNALASADAYVWCYSEKMNWWKNEGIPPGLPEAIVAARGKIARGQALGYDLGPTLREAERKLRAELEARTIHRTAHIAPRPAGTPPPVIDGRLDDPVWQAIRPLERFLPYATSGNASIQAATEVRVTYDDENLYLAVRCDEPTPQLMRALGAARDDDQIWEGDSVDLFLSVGEEPAPYAHLILNPKNLPWDDLVGDGLDRQVYDPVYRSATRIGENAWFIEMALPWKEIRIPAPESGERHRANVCRQRIPGREWSCWSQALDHFTEPESFGTWVFAPSPE
jgi:hypothetical protein